MRHGTTLPELLLAMVLFGLLLGLAAPRAAAARDRALLSLHARALVAAHSDTRAYALRAGSRTILSLSAVAFEQRNLAGVVLWRRSGPAQDGVELAGPAAPIVFDSRGYTLGAANGTYRLMRGSQERRVIISRLGRVRVVP